VQFLNGFFTYMATVSMPWRCSNMLHTLGWACPRRERSPGHDLYGQVTDDVWFSVPLRQRAWILQYLLWNCLTQYANQVTRIIYYNYELQNEYPGNLWTNLFFGLSMLCAATGGTLMAYHTGKVRARDPARFGPGPVQLARDLYKQVVWGKVEWQKGSSLWTAVVRLGAQVRIRLPLIRHESHSDGRLWKCLALLCGYSPCRYVFQGSKYESGQRLFRVNHRLTRN
jgi:hypothetical protein